MSVARPQSLTYLSGFHQHVSSEAIPNALPQGQNAPQHVPFGLVTEQLSGSAFTSPSPENYFAWLYRIRPSVVCGEFTPYDQTRCQTRAFTSEFTPPTAMRWNASPYPDTATDFIDGLTTFAGHGNPSHHTGAATHLYAINQSMSDRFFYNADGELLFIPQEGGLRLRTEFGILEIEPTQIAVIPRGVKFQVQLLQDKARGYVCENFGRPFRLPERGVIGANGLANVRDFQMPVAAFEAIDGAYTLITKFQGRFFQAPLTHSPLNVVAWHGNYAPYRYDLSFFNVINTVSYDHPDPSIFTVLTSPNATPGVANVDFVIFPPRWMVAEHTFRPPYYHRNVMSELMGLIHGSYDAKPNGFHPGGLSLHNTMTAHGPDATAYQQAISADLNPHRMKHTLAFMLESEHPWCLTADAYDSPQRDRAYLSCWQTLESHFSPP